MNLLGKVRKCFVNGMEIDVRKKRPRAFEILDLAYQAGAIPKLNFWKDPWGFWHQHLQPGWSHRNYKLVGLGRPESQAHRHYEVVDLWEEDRFITLRRGHRPSWSRQ